MKLGLKGKYNVSDFLVAFNDMIIQSGIKSFTYPTLYFNGYEDGSFKKKLPENAKCSSPPKPSMIQPPKDTVFFSAVAAEDVPW